MCLVALAIDQSRRFPLVVAANRDEFFDRAAARLGWWSPGEGLPDILGGRDLQSGGTWLGLTAQGRLAIVTNVRNAALPQDPNAPSRGEIAQRWLAGGMPTDRFWMRTALNGYNGFNLIAADFQQGECFWGSNHNTLPVRLERGLYGLSNAALDTPWPKVEALKACLQDAIEAGDSVNGLASVLFDGLADRRTASGIALPSTGVSPEWEQMLSAAFIRSADQTYGTRCSTLIITERVNKRLITHVFERSYAAHGSMALLRRSLIKDWPPRYSVAPSSQPAAQEAVTEVSDLHEMPPAPVRKTRVRSLLKPDIAMPKRSAGSAL
jgi:uncharacterized protein with NRDE domain